MPTDHRDANPEVTRLVAAAQRLEGEAAAFARHAERLAARIDSDPANHNHDHNHCPCNHGQTEPGKEK